jgi:metal-dependent amidase/aminoacylase/carboxypeptidase family protein
MLVLYCCFRMLLLAFRWLRRKPCYARIWPIRQEATAGADETYKHLHENPELSKQEVQTAAFVAGELRKLGYTVTEHVGKYEDGTQAEGVVAVLENGAGPRLLLRTELDALPVEEKTGLDYASHVKTTNAQGAGGERDACLRARSAHDGAAGCGERMAERKSQWHGTLMLIGQPAEEMIRARRRCCGIICMSGLGGRILCCRSTTRTTWRRARLR